MDKQNPNIKRSRIWTGAAKGQKEKPGVEKYRRERVSGRSDAGLGLPRSRCLGRSEGRDREGPPATEPWEFAQEIRCRDQPATPG